MSLIICVLCGHPAIYHEDHGCTEIVFGDRPDDVTGCDCRRTEREVYEQEVPAP